MGLWQSGRLRQTVNLLFHTMVRIHVGPQLTFIVKKMRVCSFDGFWKMLEKKPLFLNKIL